MSHFTVLVIGENHEQQLQPYHEFESTGTDDQYVQDIDVTRQCKENGLGYDDLEDRTILNESDLDLSGTHKYGYAVVGPSGEIIKAIHRTNPNRKWDWYVLGGRWSGMLKMKDGCYGYIREASLMNPSRTSDLADAAYKRDIDWEGMRKNAAIEAALHYDKIHAIIGPYKDGFVTLDAMMEQHGIERRDETLKIYHEQPLMQAIHKSPEFLDRRDIELLAGDRSAYLERAKRRAGITFAVVKDGKWYERGLMGFWAQVSDEKDEAEWEVQFNDLLNSASDDSRISVFDCHI